MDGLFILKYKSGLVSHINARNVRSFGLDEKGSRFAFCFIDGDKYSVNFSDVESLDYIYDRTDMTHVKDNFVNKTTSDFIKQINEKILKLNGHDV